jgi:hypothetical protein
MRALAVILIALMVSVFAMGVSGFAAVNPSSALVAAPQKGNKDPKKKDPPGPPVVRDKKERDRGKEPPPKPKKPGN